MKNKTMKRVMFNKVTSGLARVWVSVCLATAACLSCSDDSLIAGSSTGDADETATTGKILFSVGEMTRLDYDSINTDFEDGEYVGCIVMRNDSFLANTRWHYDIHGNYLCVDTLWMKENPDDGITATAPDAEGALLVTDDEGYTATTSNDPLNLYFYYPYIGPETTESDSIHYSMGMPWTDDKTLLDTVTTYSYESFPMFVNINQNNRKSLGASDFLWVTYKGLTCRASGTAHMTFKKKNAMLRICSTEKIARAWLTPGEKGIVYGKNINLVTGVTSQYTHSNNALDSCITAGDFRPYNLKGDSTEYRLVLPAQIIDSATICLNFIQGGGKASTFKHVIDGDTLNEDDLYTVVFYQSVDLGLSVYWATCNVGATSPEDYGDYYAWGETETKDTFNLSNSTWYQQDAEDISGTEYDVAHVKWGGSWRMPTLDECKELVNDCEWLWTTLNDVKGYQVTGKNGNSIFLPAAGYRNGTSRYRAGSYGYYWSSTPRGSNTQVANSLYFYSAYRFTNWNDRNRYYGQSVRPVAEF